MGKIVANVMKAINWVLSLFNFRLIQLTANPICKITTLEHDFVRVSTLELISQEIKINNVEGDVAELGVYKGKFAA